MSTGFNEEFDFGRGQATASLPADMARMQAASRREGKIRRRSERPSGKPQADDGASQLMADDIRAMRRKRLALGAVLLLVTGFSLCITSSSPLLVSPLEVVQVYALRIQQLWLQAFDPANAPTAYEVTGEHPLFYWTLTNLGITLKYVLAGFMLALSGMLYQNVFRNPIASPATLGVASGIQLGVLVVLLAFGAAGGMLALDLARYAASYGAVTVILVLLIVFSQFMSGRGRPNNVVNMLLVGTILNQLIGVIVTYITWFMLDDDLYDVFVSMTTMVTPSNDLASWAVLLAGFALSVTPVLLLRFRMNALSFSAGEMRMFGIRASRLQFLALVCGTVVMVTAQLQVGAVAMITLVVPPISRAVFGAEFRKQLVGTMLIGASVLVACHILAVVIPYSGEIPVGVVVNLVLLPAFVWLIATQQRRWD